MSSEFDHFAPDSEVAQLGFSRAIRTINSRPLDLPLQDLHLSTQDQHPGCTPGVLVIPMTAGRCPERANRDATKLIPERQGLSAGVEDQTAPKPPADLLPEQTQLSQNLRGVRSLGP